MKTIALCSYTAVVIAVTAATGTVGALADQPPVATGHVKHWTGTVVSVSPKDHVIRVKEFLLSKEFNLGNSCAYTFVDKAGGTAEDLRPGQKVKVAYENHRGVLVADQVAQEPMRFEGKVRAMDPQQHTITMRHHELDKTFQIGSDCGVTLHHDKPGTLANVQPGERVTITYETPGGVATARQIAQTSELFTGALTAIDLSERTVKAKALLGTKRFNLADGYTIVLGGKPAGHMNDLKPGDKITVSYDEVNGVNVADRIADTGASTETMTAQSSQ